MKKLLEYIIEEPPANSTHKRGHKFPFVVSEILNIDHSPLLDVFFANEEEEQDNDNEGENEGEEYDDDNKDDDAAHSNFKDADGEEAEPRHSDTSNNTQDEDKENLDKPPEFIRNDSLELNRIEPLDEKEESANESQEATTSPTESSKFYLNFK